MAAGRNLVNFKDVGKGYASRTVLEDVTLGVADGDRIGIVGRNGDGKSTLLRLIAGVETADSGAVTHVGGLNLALLAQSDELRDDKTIREELVGSRAQHEWASDGTFREVLGGLLGGVELTRFEYGIETPIGALSGGERRRIALARGLLDNPDLLLLDEPTNHLDVEGVQWLAGHLAARRRALVVVTHDRWFLDAVCTATWEVADKAVHQYEGGYAAYILARAERARQEAARDARRQQLLRKELAWLRRGPPARTAKPKFRIEAANALIADEPEIRDRAELLRFASARLGDRVVDAEGVSVGFDGNQLLEKATWRLGPGDRVAVVGVNGSGKSTLLNLIGGELDPATGEVKRGATVRLAHLSQNAVELPGHLRVLESLEEVRGNAKLGDGRELTAGTLCERFGFRGDRARTLVRDLSGGERRRLQLMRLLMGEPNVLLLDEPTNDLDTDTLAALEDLLDAWPGTLVVVSHDRYFVERVCDNVYALMGDGGIRHLPGGIEQYLELRRQSSQGPPAAANGTSPASRGVASPMSGATSPPSSDKISAAGRVSSPANEATGASVAKRAPAGAAIRAARKEIQKLERALDKLGEKEAALHDEMAASATDHEQLRALDAQLQTLSEERERLEASWLETAESLEA